VTPVVADERIKAQFETAAKTIVNDAEAAARAAGANDVETEVLIGPPARERSARKLPMWVRTSSRSARTDVVASIGSYSAASPNAFFEPRRLLF